MKLWAEKRLQTAYMTAQNLAYHERLAARAAELVRRSAELRQRSRQARFVSERLRGSLEEYFSLAIQADLLNR